MQLKQWKAMDIFLLVQFYWFQIYLISVDSFNITKPIPSTQIAIITIV